MATVRRYDQTNKIYDKRKSYYGTTYYAEIPERNDDVHLIAQHGDRCDLLAQQFYGNPHLWWFVARVNHLKTMNIEA